MAPLLGMVSITLIKLFVGVGKMGMIDQGLSLRVQWTRRKGRTGEIKHNMNGFSNQMPCFQWPYMWNPVLPLSPFCPSSFPVCVILPSTSLVEGTITWNFPWVTPAFSGRKCSVSNPNFPTLGKHLRDGEMLNQREQERSSGTPIVLVSETLRMDALDEAAKSSVGTTLGIKKGDSLSKRGFFNGLPSNTGD